MFKSYYGHFVADATLAKVEALEKIAAQAGISLVELALSWLARNAVVSSVIAGATRPEQVDDQCEGDQGQPARGSGEGGRRRARYDRLR